MTSAEIREKIAELKIRLAFQLEFEEELKKTLAECEDADSEQEEQRTDRSAEILGRIEAEARKRKSGKMKEMVRGRGRSREPPGSLGTHSLEAIPTQTLISENL